MNLEYPHSNWIEVNLSAVESNTQYVLEKTGVDAMAVVKTNAYGLGAVEIAKAVLRAGAKWLAVVRVSEVKELRQAGITAPIMVFGGAMPGEVEMVIAQDAVLPVYDRDLAKFYSEKALAMGRKLRVHLKVDTGLGRFGVFPGDALDFARYLHTLEGLEVEGLMSHMAVAHREDNLDGALQISRFRDVVETFRAAGILPAWQHLSSSGSVLNLPDSYFNLVRVGSFLYGLTDFDASHAPWGLPPGIRSVFSWKTQVVSVRRFPAGWTVGYDATYITKEDEVIAVLPVGHGDGYLRSPAGEVLVNGARVPIVGKICMDQLMVSLPEMVPLGTEVVLVGRQGDEVITPQALAKRWGASTVTATNANRRIPRVYVRD